jgi:hypothetical protein
MTRYLSGILYFLMPFLAYAQEAKDAPMPETINWFGIIIFLVIFVGGTVGFFVLLWRNERKRKQLEKKQ